MDQLTATNLRSEKFSGDIDCYHQFTARFLLRQLLLSDMLQSHASPSEKIDSSKAKEYARAFVSNWLQMCAHPKYFMNKCRSRGPRANLTIELEEESVKRVHVCSSPSSWENVKIPHQQAFQDLLNVLLFKKHLKKAFNICVLHGLLSLQLPFFDVNGDGNLGLNELSRYFLE